MLTLVLVVGGGLIVGLLANALFRQYVVADDADGPSPQALLAPITTFSALFIAIVLSGASGTYSSARHAAADEANVIDNMFEATAYVEQDRFKAGLQAALVCYARAVEGPGWEAMGRGNTSTQGSAASLWTGTGPHGLRLKFRRMGVAHPMFGTLTSLDRQRGDTRRSRLALAVPQVPAIIAAFMLVLVFASIFTLAFFIPRTHNTAQRVTLLVVAIVLVCSLALVRSLDRPYRGVLKIEPTAMQQTAADISADFDEDWGARRLPCDKRGEPLDRA
jgi:hypothetical protein